MDRKGHDSVRSWPWLLSKRLTVELSLRELPELGFRELVLGTSLLLPYAGLPRNRAEYLLNGYQLVMCKISKINQEADPNRI